MVSKMPYARTTWAQKSNGLIAMKLGVHHNLVVSAPDCLPGWGYRLYRFYFFTIAYVFVFAFAEDTAKREVFEETGLRTSKFIKLEMEL